MEHSSYNSKPGFLYRHVFGYRPAYFASSVQDFLAEKDTVNKGFIPFYIPFRTLEDGRAIVFFANPLLYKVETGKYVMKDSTGSIECVRIPFWSPLPGRTPQKIQDGKQHTVALTYKSESAPIFLEFAEKFGPGEEEPNLEKITEEDAGINAAAMPSWT